MDLSAPGVAILTTRNGGGYGNSSGTSFASPVVAGLAALMLGADPDLTHVEVELLLEETAVDLGEPRYDTSFGYGCVDAYEAVLAAAGGAPPATACSDGVDNDGDGWIDDPDDPGCANADDLSEHSPLLVCDDGVDNDGDNLIDYPADPGCFHPASSIEDLQCQDGVKNDCVAAHGTFSFNEEEGYSLTPQDKPATAFLFELIARLQDVATVPMIDVRAYAEWLRPRSGDE